MDSYSVTDDTKEVDCDLLRSHRHENFLNTPIKDTGTLPPVRFTISKMPTMFSNKFATFNPVTPIPNFTIAFASPGKDTDNSLKKCNTINVNSLQIVRFKNEILQSL